MPDSFVSSIEPHAVADIEPVHGGGKIGVGSFDQEMKMVVHQYIGMDNNAELIHGLLQQLSETVSIPEIKKDPFFLIAARSNVIPSAGSLQPNLPGHCQDFYIHVGIQVKRKI
jgi:hypothetical protein